MYILGWLFSEKPEVLFFFFLFLIRFVSLGCPLGSTGIPLLTPCCLSVVLMPLVLSRRHVIYTAKALATHTTGCSGAKNVGKL